MLDHDKYQCSGCSRILDNCEFYWNEKRGYRHSSKCKSCYQLSRRGYQIDYAQRNRDSINKKNREKYCPEVREEYRIKSYGMSLSEYDSLLEEQGGGCAICGSTSPKTPRNGRFCVDHNHDNGEVRGLLCSPCNRGIGLLKDDSSILWSAYEYLKSRDC